MPNFKTRSEEEEIMDDFSIDDAGLHRTLRELEIINKWLGGNAITVNALRKTLPKFRSHKTSLRIVDLGCGSGDMLRLIYDTFGEEYSLELIGIDANPAVVNHAVEKNKGTYPIEYQVVDILSEDFKKQSYDIVLCTLFLHHFPDTTLVDILSSLKKQTKSALIINDLHRHFLAYHSIHLLTTLFSRSYMTRYDAKLSVLRAFSKKEISQMLKKSGWKTFSIQWKWAFRWAVVGEV